MRTLVIGHFLDLPEAKLFAALARRGVEIECLVHPDSPHLEVLREVGVECRPLVLRARVSPSATLLIRQRLLRNHYDVIHTLSARALSNSLFASFGLSVRHVTYRGTMGNLSRWDPSSWITYLNPRVEKIFCVSRAVENFLREVGIAPSKLATVYKGHELEWYSRLSSSSLTSLGIPSDAFVVGCVANMRKDKGVDILIKAAFELAKIKNIYFLLIGEIRDSTIKRLLSEIPAGVNLVTPGFRSDAVELISQTNLFVMPSRTREGLPKALIEAMSQALPCIVSNVGGLPELIEDGGNGYVFESGDFHALADRVLEMKNAPEKAKEMGRLGQLRIERFFNHRQHVDGIYNVYSELLSNATASRKCS